VLGAPNSRQCRCWFSWNDYTPFSDILVYHLATPISAEVKYDRSIRNRSPSSSESGSRGPNIVNAAKTQLNRALFALAAGTEARAGELFALRVETDVNLNEQTITIAARSLRAKKILRRATRAMRTEPERCPIYASVMMEAAVPYRLMAMIIGTVTTNDNVERSSADADSASMALYLAASRTTIVARGKLQQTSASRANGLCT
jgi:hypothetical protein